MKHQRQSWIVALSLALLAAAPVSAFEALAARSFYQSESEAALLLYDLPGDFNAGHADSGLRADVSAAGGTIVQNVTVHRGRHLTVSFPTTELPLGSSRLSVRLRADGRDLGSASAEVIRRPTKANAVQIDRLGGGLIVDGLPFFPFGFYCYSPVQPTLAAEEVVRGFNLISPYQSNDPATIDERRRYMDQAAALDMKVHFQLLSVAGGGGVNLGTAQDSSAARRSQWLRAEIEAFRDHPALLAWYISDEPTGHGATPEELEAAAAIVRELDPYHPVTIVFVNPAAAARFSAAMDLAMTDPYPIPNGPPGSVADAVRTVRDAVAPRIPLWLVPQAFGGNEFWSREPTATELRLMSWLGIIEGVTGIQYFIRDGLSGFPKSPDTWAAAGRVAREVAALTPYLLSSEARPVVDTGDEDLHATAWRDGDDVLVAVVNTLNYPREMEVSLPELTFAHAESEVLYEDRAVALKRIFRAGPLSLLFKPVGIIGGLLRTSADIRPGVRFDDIIDAYGVRLYRFADPAPIVAAEMNLLIDPSFEWDASPSIPTAVYADVGAGRGATYFVDRRDAVSGRRSLRLHATSKDDGVRISPFSPSIVAGRTYRFSVWARSRLPGAVLRLRNSAGGDSLDAELTTEWQPYWLDSAVEAVSSSVWLSLRLASAGTAWVDDMALFDISPRIDAVPTPEGHEVSIESIIDDSVLRLRLDGMPVTASDPVYSGPQSLTGSNQVRVGLFREGRHISDTSLDLHHHDGLGRFVDLENPFASRYAAGGAGALTNGILGTGQFTDGHWQGFEGQDLVATIDLGRKLDVSSVSVRFLQNLEAWIWMPSIMEVNVSDDGRNFRSFATVDHGVDERKMGIAIEQLTARAATEQARYIRVRARSVGVCPEWHAGAGGPAWVFADEIRVNTE